MPNNKSINLKKKQPKEIGGIMDKYNNDVNKFWLKYREAVIENSIGEKYADHYVKWGENQVIRNQQLKRRS